MKKSLGAKTIVIPAPVFVVGTWDAEGRPNAMTVAWGGVCSSRPPCMCVSVREATYTHGNLFARRAFTINVPSVDQAREADYMGIYSGRDENKFETAGWTAVASEAVDAPIIDECGLVLECKLTHSINLGLHTQFIGEVVDAKADESILDEHGRVDADKLRPFVWSAAGDNRYFALGECIGNAFSLGRKS